MIRWFSVFLFLVTFGSFAQNEQLAMMYLNKGEFEKALLAYQELYKSQPTNNNFMLKVVECYQQLNQLDKSNEVLQDYFKKFKLPLMYVEIGYNYKLQQNESLKSQFYDQALDQIKKQYTNVYQVAQSFEKKVELDYALRSYQLALQMEPSGRFNYQMALLHGQMGNMELMIEKFLEEAYQFPESQPMVQNQLTRFMDDENESDFNALLRKNLILKTQKSQDIFWNQFLSWYYVQTRQYDKAFVQEKAIYKRNPESFYNIVDLAEIAAKEEDPSAESIFQFILQNTTDAELVVQCHHFLLNLKMEQNQTQDYPKIQKQFQELFQQFGQNERTLALMQLQANFEAFSLQNTKKAKEILEQCLTFRLNNKQRAEVKMDLADVLLLEEKFSMALLQYAQVEEDMKGDVLGQEANLKMAKTSFYQQDFEWALQQFKVLKSAHSQLIANDALEMFLLLSDNNPSDSLQLALKQFAKADFLAYQNKHTQSIAAFQKIIQDFAEDEVLDDVHYRLGTVFMEKKKFQEAVSHFEVILQQFPESVYRDEAYYFLGEVYYKELQNPIKAQSYYEQVIMQHPDSIYLVDAQKRFRAIRGDKNL